MQMGGDLGQVCRGLLEYFLRKPIKWARIRWILRSSVSVANRAVSSEFMSKVCSSVSRRNVGEERAEVSGYWTELAVRCTPGDVVV
jgi:hypothetical protein